MYADGSKANLFTIEAAAPVASRLGADEASAPT